jgi:hypothetical protein
MPPWVELQLDARVPGCAAAPKPSPRRAMARPTKAFATGFLDAENNPRGSSTSSTPARLDSQLYPSHRRVEPWLDPRTPSRMDRSTFKTTPVGRAPARRLRAWIRSCTQAIAASSHGSTHEGLSFLDSSTLKTTPVGRAPARRPRAWMPRCAHVIAHTPKPSPRRAMARPTNTTPTSPKKKPPASGAGGFFASVMQRYTRRFRPFATPTSRPRPASISAYVPGSGTGIVWSD